MMMMADVLFEEVTTRILRMKMISENVGLILRFEDKIIVTVTGFWKLLNGHSVVERGGN